VALSVIELAAITAQPKEPSRALSAIAELRDRLEELERFHVENARDYGLSWNEIAQPLRVTRQAVHRKHARRLARADLDSGDRRIMVAADARRCVARAREEARALGHHSVGTDHLVLGVLGEASTAALLGDLGLSLQATREAVIELRAPAHRGRKTPKDDAVIEVSPRARKALEQSLREAVRLGDAEIGAKHVLLAALRDGSAARRLLNRLGVAAAAVRERAEP
jgi:hypothetical protein